MSWYMADGSTARCTCATKKPGEVCLEHMNDDATPAARAAATIDDEWAELNRN